MHAQPLPAGLHSALYLFSMVMQDGHADDAHQAAESFRDSDGMSAGRLEPELVQCRKKAVSGAASYAVTGRQLSRPIRWGINE